MTFIYAPTDDYEALEAAIDEQESREAAAASAQIEHDQQAAQAVPA